MTNYWKDIQRKSRELGAYDKGSIDSILVDPDTGLPMAEDQAKAYTEIEVLALDSIVRADAAHIAHLVLEGLTAEADAYATDPAVASRIRRWKEARA